MMTTSSTAAAAIRCTPTRSAVRSASVFLLVSTAAVMPCLWHARIAASDLGSHLYSAWLALGIGRGNYPGLYLAPVHTNVLFDIIATRLLSWFQPSTAERIAVSSCVLVFFWGAFSAVSALTERRNWGITPLLLVLAHGFVFQLGLMNFYLSAGIALFALALLWRPSLTRLPLACALLGLAAVAQPMAPLWVALCIVYKMVFERFPRYRLWLLAAGVVVTAAGNAVLLVFMPTSWSFSLRRHATGAEQALIFGFDYNLIALAFLILGVVLFVRRCRFDWRFWIHDVVAHYWVLLIAAGTILPDEIVLRQYAMPYGGITERLSFFAAVIGIAVIAVLRPRRTDIAAMAIIAIAFFLMLYRDTGRLSKIQRQFDNIVRRFPPQQRFVSGLMDYRTTRVGRLYHMLGRACIGRCFDYGSYEVATGQFRLRARGPNPFIQIDFNPNVAEKFRNTNPGMTLYNIDWCRPASDELCVKEIALQQASAERP